jgi:hypothetical protein
MNMYSELPLSGRVRVSRRVSFVLPNHLLQSPATTTMKAVFRAYLSFKVKNWKSCTRKASGGKLAIVMVALAVGSAFLEQQFER